MDKIAIPTNLLYNTNNTNNTNTFSNEKQKLPICSYGLLCFYKKKIFVKDLPIVNNLVNRKTKKTEFNVKHNRYNPNHNVNNTANLNNVSRIKILKRHETISYTLKNMLGIVGSHNDALEINDELDTYESNESNENETIINNEKIENNIKNTESTNIESTNTTIETENNKATTNTTTETANTTKSNITMKEIIIDKVLLVQRRNTIGMIEFVRGKYDITNYDYIIKLFNMMTFDEKRILREYNSFDIIRTCIGLKREFHYKSEYDDAKAKFNKLKNHENGDLVNSLLDKSITKWSSPEWGIPKGRKNNKEYNIECAIREFVEETGINYNNINVYRNIKPIEEIYTGINDVIYKHIYFIAEIKNTSEANENIVRVEKGGQMNYEISNIKLFSLAESHKLIRPYYMSKLNAIKEGFQIITDINNHFE